MDKLRIAAFGFRTIPPSKGAAGADKFALELFPRLVKRGHSVIAYNRRYPDVYVEGTEYKGVKIKTFKTTNIKGFDTLLHSLKCTWDIIVHNTADIVHIQNGGNSISALPLRIFGKKVFISQDGIDWKRDKWPWYGKLYLKLSAYITSSLPNQVIFDNVIAKRFFEEKFKKKFEFIPFGSEVVAVTEDDSILKKYNLSKGGYYLFVGRFIPDKGLHYLIPAFTQADTNKKLVLIGGSPNPSKYEQEIRQLSNENVIFAGFMYGDDVIRLMLNSYCYIQPSDVEGLSPAVLTIMGLGVPLIVSDIEENLYAVQYTALKFKKTDINSLLCQINYAENNYQEMMDLAVKAKKRALQEFNWDKVTEEHIQVFSGYSLNKK
jgi:glycosyltransferase involved in cell wall biosynthesis